MGLLADCRRSLSDQFMNEEENTGSPKPHLRKLEANLHTLTPTVRLTEIQFLRSYSEKYYKGFHSEATVPSEVAQTFRKLDRQAEKLNVLSAADEVIRRHGGPPTKDTIYEAIDRSEKERIASRMAALTPEPTTHRVATKLAEAAPSTVKSATKSTREHSMEMAP